MDSVTGINNSGSDQSLKEAKRGSGREVARTRRTLARRRLTGEPTRPRDVSRLGRLAFPSVLPGPVRASQAPMRRAQPSGSGPAPPPTPVGLGKGGREAGVRVPEGVLLRVGAGISFLAPDGFCSRGPCARFLEPAELIIAVGCLSGSASITQNKPVPSGG